MSLPRAKAVRWGRKGAITPAPVQIVEQLALFLANQPGTLAAVCDALAEADVNIYGLTVSDTIDHSVVRLVVSDTAKALAIFEAHGTLVVENDVIMIANDNRPGSVSRIAELLSKHKIHIEYAYLASMPSARKGLLILRVSQTPKALRLLEKLFEA